MPEKLIDVIVTCESLPVVREGEETYYAQRGMRVQLTEAEHRRLSRAGDPSGLPAFPPFVEPGHPALDEPLVRDGVPQSMANEVAWARLRAAFAERPPKEKAKS